MSATEDDEECPSAHKACGGAEDARGLLRDVYAFRTLQFRDAELAKLHQRRADNLLAQIRMRERLLAPLEQRVEARMQALREASMVAISEPERRSASELLCAMKSALRGAGTLGSLAPELARLVAQYDSDSELIAMEPAKRSRAKRVVTVMATA